MKKLSELDRKLLEIMCSHTMKPGYLHIKFFEAMKSAYRAGWMDCLEEQAKGENTNADA